MIYFLAPHLRRARYQATLLGLGSNQYHYIAREEMLMGVLEPKVVDLYDIEDRDYRYTVLCDLLASRQAVFYSLGEVSRLVEADGP
jgi:hypothetical protein